jgi:hypothetical protein
MIVIAVLLFAAVAAATAGVIAGAQGNVSFDIFDEAISASPPEVFAAGAACGLAVAIGLWMARIGARRHASAAGVRIRRDRDREHAELAREREALGPNGRACTRPSRDRAEPAGPGRRFAPAGKRGARTAQDESARGRSNDDIHKSAAEAQPPHRCVCVADTPVD